MKTRRLILALAVMLPLTASLPAAASIPEIPDPNESEFDARQLFYSRKCQVRGVLEDRTVVLYDELSRKTHEIRLSEKVKLRAVAKKEFDGRKKLAFADFAEGQRVKVNVRKSDGRILRIDFLPKAK